MGLGSLIYALAKLDGPLHRDEMQAVRDLFANEPQGDLVLYSFFIRENAGETVEDAYAFGLRRIASQRLEINQETIKRFISILRRVAKAHEGISRQERIFIQRFWREVRQVHKAEPKMHEVAVS